MTDDQIQPQNNIQNSTQNNGQTPGQSPMTAFGGALPFSNVPNKTPVQNEDVVYSTGPESAPIKISPETPQAPEQTTEKIAENKPELNTNSIEKREQKAVYPQNQQTNNSHPPVLPVQPIKPVQQGPRFYGYKVAPQIANNFALIVQQKGKGKPDESRTWIYMLLDRILKKQAYIKK